MQQVTVNDELITPTLHEMPTKLLFCGTPRHFHFKKLMQIHICVALK